MKWLRENKIMLITVTILKLINKTHFSADYDVLAVKYR